jgi:hypothetical protein
MCHVFCWKLEWKTEVVKPSIEGQCSASIAQVTSFRCSMSCLHYMWKPNSELLENLCQVMLFRAMLSYSSKRCITRKFSHLAIGDLLQHTLWDLLIAMLSAFWAYALFSSAEAWILITSQALCLSAGKFLPTICIHLMIVQISLGFCSEGYVGRVMLRH